MQSSVAGRILTVPTSLAVSTISAILLAFFVPFPVSAQSDSQSSAIEQAAHQAGFTIDNDPAGLLRVQNIVNRIFRVADNKDALVAPPVRIVASKEPPNAKADGRYLFVTQSLLALLPDDNELAIVLGHELAHHILGHSKGASLEYQISSAARRLGFRGDLPTILDATTQAQEAQADRYGLLYAALAGYDISAAPHVYDKMLMSDDDSTHPPKAEREKIFRDRLQAILDAVDSFNVGVEYTIRGQFASAEMVFQDLLHNDFRTYDIYHNLGALHQLLAFRKYLLPKDSPASICSVNLELTSSLEPQGARRELSRRGSDSPTGSDKTQFTTELGRAIDFYQQALRAKPYSVVTLSNLGCAYLYRGEEGDLDQAVGALRRAAKLDPHDASAAGNLGVAFWLRGNKEDAVRQFRLALQINPAFAPAHYNLGVALEATGDARDKDESLRAFQQYLNDAGSLPTPYYLTQARQRLGLQSEPDSPSAKTNATPSARDNSRSALPVSPGDSASNISSDLGTPRKLMVSADGDIQLWQFADWEILIQQGQVDQITTASTHSQTPDGIHVASNVQEVRKIYGVPDAEQSRGEFTVLCYLGQGFLFRVREGKVYAWSAF